MSKVNLNIELTVFIGDPYFDENDQVNVYLGAVQYKDGKMVVV